MEHLPAPQRDYVEHLAQGLADIGLARMPARVLALFICADESALSAADVTEALGISQAAASPALHNLVQRGLLAWTPVPGSRRDHYRLVADAWIEVAHLRAQRFAELAELVRVGHDMVPPGGPAAGRLERMDDFFGFLAGELPEIVQRWQERHPG